MMTEELWDRFRTLCEEGESLMAELAGCGKNEDDAQALLFALTTIVAQLNDVSIHMEMPNDLEIFEDTLDLLNL